MTIGLNGTVPGTDIERGLDRDDLIVITGGTPLGVPGTTNFLKVQKV